MGFFKKTKTKTQTFVFLLEDPQFPAWTQSHEAGQADSNFKTLNK